MSKIQVLDQHTIDKIAAGEVVERPSAIVKELVENSIDAGANAITVEIKDGGISFIRITDNGTGIEREQVRTAFLSHATSKIRSVEDLITVGSLGFRGEALSSIAAVAQVELVTKTSHGLTGVRYVIEGGKEVSFEEIGCPEGTTFLVRNLFYNTPARKKFLKTGSTEASHIDGLLQKLSLSHPTISFKFINNNQNKLYTTGNGNPKDIIYHIYGKEITSNLIPVEAINDNIIMKGFIGKPYVSRGNRTYENYFVNGRYVKSDIINKAIEEGYKTYTMVHKYPFVCLDFQIDSELIDVNVHPAKMELRFVNSEELYGFIVDSIREALREKELIPTVPIDERKPEKRTFPEARVPEPFEQRRREIEQPLTPRANPYSMKNPNIGTPIVEAAKLEIDKLIPDRVAETNDYTVSETPNVSADIPKNTLPKPEQLDLFQENILKEEENIHFKVLGQLFKTYWLIELDEKLMIMDQHAAHEKVNYERLIKAFEQKEIYGQQLDPPMIVTLNMKEANVIKTYQTYFEDLGYKIEAFGGDEYCIRSVPANLYGLGERDVFIELLDAISDDMGITNGNLITNKIASMSCKAAIKGNQKITYEEVNGLLDELMKLDNPYTCPHGRPTMIVMTKTEIEKKFKRIQS